MVTNPRPEEHEPRSFGAKEVSLPVAIAIMLGTFALVVTSGFYVGYRFFWDKYDRASRVDSEVNKWAQVLSKEPQNYDASVKLGWAYYEKGEMDQAFKYTKAATEIKPEEPAAIYNLGLIYYQKKQYNEAREIFQKLSEKYQKNAAVWLSLGQANITLGKSDEAIKALEWLVSGIEPTSSNGHHALGEAYEQAGQKEKAIAAYQTALKFDPQYQSAQDALKRLGVTKP